MIRIRPFHTVAFLVGALFLRAQPVVPAGGTVNAADYSRRVAPGSYITIFGERLAPRFEHAQVTPLPLELLGTRVEVTDGVAARQLPLWYVSPTQVAGQLYYDLGSPVGVRVVTPQGSSGWDTIVLVPHAPAFYTYNEAGGGRAILLHTDGTLVTRQNPLKPGEWVSLYGNSLGAVEPPSPAGRAAGDGSVGNPLSLVSGAVSVEIEGRPSEVSFAGLAPYYPGLYQVNLFTPYYDVIGDLAIAMRVQNAESIAPVSVPVVPNGFYFLLGGGKFPEGQTRNALPVPGSAVCFLHNMREVWGENGYRAWTHRAEVGPEFVACSGLALTLKQGDAIVYDNNGIEDGSGRFYYDNSGGAVLDREKPGLWEWFSMSNQFHAIFAGYFRLTRTVTVDQIIGYFDSNGSFELPFDPGNVYNKFRMNIWSMGPDGHPAVPSFAGDVFTTDAAPGRFEYSPTGVRRIFRDGANDEIYRMVFLPDEPLTLPAGEYWFGHDTAVPHGAESPLVSGSRAARAVRVRPSGNIRFGR